MKGFFYTPLLTFLLVACNARERNTEAVKVNTKDIAMGPVVHDSLSGDQMEKIRRIQKTFAEVYPASLEETITNFKRDQNPDKEIAVWLTMASVYETFIGKHPDADSVKKQEAFKVTLLRSMMPEQEAVKEAQPTALSREEIADLLSIYKAAAVPVTTR